jgi:hypothetical protein
MSRGTATNSSSSSSEPRALQKDVQKGRTRLYHIRRIVAIRAEIERDVIMEPLSAIGAAASIISVAQTALALSSTIYSVCGALASASEDLKELADDLKVFSQSLTLLSRLLDDNRAWYADEIYLLAAKIIKDCVSLYKKIDAILVKLDSGRKARWTKKVMFVVKGPQIRKLLERLRRLKGTLATILMSLQVDLQLSLL